MTEDCSWPEQDAVDAWVARNKIDLPREVIRELKEDVTVYRLEVQVKLGKVLENPYRVAMEKSILELLEDENPLCYSQMSTELGYIYADFNCLRDVMESLQKRGLVILDDKASLIRKSEASQDQSGS